MPAIDFPSSPTLNQTHTANGRTWRWDGSSWASANALTASDVTGALTYTPENVANKGQNSGYAGLDASARLVVSQLPAFTGDATSAAGSDALTLANSGVGAGTYTKVTVDAKGRVTGGSSLASGDLPTYSGSLTSSQITTGLGYTPFNKAGDTTTGPLRESVVVASAGTATYTFNMSLGNNWRLTLTGNPTFAFSNPPADTIAQSIVVRLIQDATGGRTITYPGSVKWTDGVAPILATAAGKIDVLTFTTDDGGAVYIGSHAIANA